MKSSQFSFKGAASPQLPPKKILMAAARNKLRAQGKEEAAIYLVAILFNGMLDGSDAPYIGHLVRTGQGMRDKGRRYLGYLHDLVENIKGWSLKDLGKVGFDQRDLDALDAVTKRPGEKYFDFITRVGNNADAIDIKLSDIADNSNFLRMPLEKLHDPAWIENKQKYHLSYYYLQSIRDKKIAPGTDFGLWLREQPCWDKNWALLERHSQTSVLLKQPRKAGKNMSGPV
jgi:hypothetical protein